jgi:hypothetical protein
MGILKWLCVAGDPDKGTCEDCYLVETTRITGYGSHSDLPTFQCDDCGIIELAKSTARNIVRNSKKQNELKAAKKYLKLV